MNFFIDFIYDFIGILNEMSPYLLLGFLFAGILHVFFPRNKIAKYLGSRNTSSVINASILGVPLPLCSCGVIPAGISFYKNGASKGSAISFLISTPQTGFDSILVTYSLLGLPFAIIRPIIAFITGIFGGIFTNITDKKNLDNSSHVDVDENSRKEEGNVIYRMFKYAFFDFMNDIAKWLVIGIFIAAAISVIIPDDFFSHTFSNELAGMLIILAVSIPAYICATASVPIAAILILKGLSPGAALVLLMAGPATNAATITLIGKTFGRRTLIVYLSTIIASALFFGYLINVIFPESWFIIPGIHQGHLHNHELLPLWLKYLSSIILGSLILISLIKTYRIKRKLNKTKQTLNIDSTMKTTTINVEGMTCNHCKMNVENGLLKIDGIKQVTADFSSGIVEITGNRIDKTEIEKTISNLGYFYKG